jgi:hypothetical protein
MYAPAGTTLWPTCEEPATPRIGRSVWSWAFQAYPSCGPAETAVSGEGGLLVASLTPLPHPQSSISVAMPRANVDLAGKAACEGIEGNMNHSSLTRIAS